MKLAICALMIALTPLPATAATNRSAEIDRYVRPYVDTANFSGVVLVARNGVPIIHKAYGLADRDRHIANRLDTRFHIASASMQFTAVAALRLIQAGKLSLNTPLPRSSPIIPMVRRSLFGIS